MKTLKTIKLIAILAFIFISCEDSSSEASEEEEIQEEITVDDALSMLDEAIDKEADGQDGEDGNDGEDDENGEDGEDGSDGENNSPVFVDDLTIIEGSWQVVESTIFRENPMPSAELNTNVLFYPATSNNLQNASVLEFTADGHVVLKNTNSTLYTFNVSNFMEGSLIIPALFNFDLGANASGSGTVSKITVILTSEGDLLIGQLFNKIGLNITYKLTRV